MNALREFVANAPYATAMFDKNMRYMAVSAQFMKDFELHADPASVEALLGRGHYEHLADVPDRWKAVHQRCLRGAVEKNDHDYFQRADGRVEWLSWGARPWREDDGEIGGLIIHSALLSPLVEAEHEVGQYWGMLEDMTETVFRFQPDGTLTYVNGAVCRWLGEEWAAVIGQNWRDVAIPEDVPLIEAKLARLSPQNPVVTVENKVIAADGAIRWAQFVNRAFYDGSGALLEIQSVGRDITELKETEEKLRRATRALKTFSAANRAIVNAESTEQLVADLCGVIVGQGGYLGAWIGQAKNDDEKSIYLLGSAGGIDAALARLNLTWADKPLGQGPASRAVRNRTVEVMITADPPRLASRRALWDEYRVGGCIALPLDDRFGFLGVLVIYTVEAEAEAFDAEEISLLTEMAAEISHGLSLQRLRADRAAAAEKALHRKKDGSRNEKVAQATEAQERHAQVRYQQLFETANDGIIVTSHETGILDVNPMMCAKLGFSRSALLGLQARDFLADRGDTRRRVEMALSTGVVFNGEVDIRRGDGSIFPAELTAAVTPDGQIMAIVRDITERRRAEATERLAAEARRNTEAELARFARIAALGEMITTISHEINQPLAAIEAASAAAENWLARDPADLAEAHAALKQVRASSHRANTIIRRVRSFHARSRPVHADFDLNDAISEVILFTAGEQNAADVRVRLELPPDLPTARGDRVQIMQVTLNLVLNAIESMRSVADGDRWLTLRTTREDRGDLLMQVEDTGVGLDADHADRIFNPYFTTREGGTGLGLAISKSIVDAHGGRIWASPAPVRGAIFAFTIPAVGGALDS